MRPAEPRPADRRRVGGGSGLVVRDHGALVPGAAARHGGRRAEAHRPGHGAAGTGADRPPPGRLVPVPAAVGPDHRLRPRPVRLSGRRVVDEPLEAYQDEIYLTGLGGLTPVLPTDLNELERGGGRPPYSAGARVYCRRCWLG